jgi:hypothetical protein
MRKIQDGQTQEVTSCICLPLEHHGEPSSTSNKSAMGFSTTPAMSASTLPSTTTIPSIVSILISKKLMKTNYPLWSTQVLPPIRAVQLEGLLIGDDKELEKTITKIVDEKFVQEPNPTYVLWVTRDQAVLEFLLSSLMRETLMHVSRCTSSVQAWSALNELYSS